ncbi:spondin domain-containing protein [Alteromonas sp. ASW11-36]|uniref:Spondin domain-containing protein n=1 Tax=Alteromonas arenosi TaxID=3055817 RepID=A0ABT7SZW1_9ALTE|nr:spondin domain-containing protein [Alteromonas sp. ASW11-36]MDM7861544.1 spondin domain-containing protein [Alteromonas sp. ASW11-36]
MGIYIPNRQQSLRLLAIAGLVATLTACGSDSDDLPTPPVPPAPPPPPPVDVSYDVTVTNLTNAQPLSPVAVVLHDEGNLWTIGESASVALEQMAEGGDTAELRALSVVLAEASGAAPIGPGGSETISITIQDNEMANISITTMLVNTNDAFTGLNAWSLADLAVGDSWTTVTRAYDAGTEANSEAAGTMPGPADGGEGFNAVRDDADFVALHPGVVTGDDGLGSSVLTVLHKIDNPVVRITITRTE